MLVFSLYHGTINCGSAITEIENQLNGGHVKLGSLNLQPFFAELISNDQ
jgi:hypothetical protein